MAVASDWFGDWQVRARYLAQSAGGLIVGLALLSGWVELAGIPPSIAVLLNWVLLAVANCLVLDRWVFPGDHATTLRGFATRLAGMQAAMLSSKGLNYVVFISLLQVDVVYQVAWVVGAGLSFAVSLALNKRWFGRVS